MFKSLPFTARKVEATEARLQAIYDAAALGLKGDSLALAAGMLPQEYRQLCQFDPVAEMAELKGRADSEREASAHLREAARAGDAKAAAVERGGCGRLGEEDGERRARNECRGRRAGRIG